jgi:hypothetical protein
MYGKVYPATTATDNNKEYREMPTKLTTRQRDKLIEAAQNAQVFAVVGDGNFPHDMLRYDHCWPATESDATRMDYASNSAVPREVRRIELRGLTGPTPARWRSFGWKVVAINPPGHAQATDHAAQRHA